jgi:hypothetical protein
VFGFSVQAQTYTGEVVFLDVDYSETIYPFDPDAGMQIEVTCSGTSSIGFSNMVVDLMTPSMSFDYDLQRTDVTGTHSIYCVDGQSSFPFTVRDVWVTASGVIGQNSTGSLTIDLLFNEDRSLLEGIATLASAFPGQETGQASLSLPSAEELLSNLVAVVLDQNLMGGISNALDRKLQNALAAMDRARSGDNASAIGILYAFIQSVEAQRGKEITETDADQLVFSAKAVIDALT